MNLCIYQYILFGSRFGGVFTEWGSQLVIDYDNFWKGVQLSHGLGHRLVVITNFGTGFANNYIEENLKECTNWT